MGNSLQPTVVGRLSLVLSPKGDPNSGASTMMALLTKLGSTRALRARNSCHLVNQYLTFMTTLCSIFFPTFNILS
jgi:hypothetical protein